LPKPENEPAREYRAVSDLELDGDIIAALQAGLPSVAEHTVAAIIVEVPSYTGALTGTMGHNIENAVRMALAVFLRLAARSKHSDPGSPLAPALDAAYELGRGEARNGRTMDALLSAYRVGARVAWRELSTTAVAGGLPAPTMAKFAELVFEYIDSLSASSASGHTDELATSGRVRQRYLDRLGKDLLTGAAIEKLVASAERADWTPPETLTAVALPVEQVRTVMVGLPNTTLQLVEDLPGVDAADTVAVLLVPDLGGIDRPRLLHALDGHDAVVGPARVWTDVLTSYRRVLRGRALPRSTDAKVVDTDARLAELVLGADAEALADLRHQVLAPLATLRPNTAERLAETLRAWLLHQGNRDNVAAALFVHPQTVRYRMGQLRDLYGERLEDPRMILELTVALALPAE
jgi:hypothetical protein